MPSERLAGAEIDPLLSSRFVKVGGDRPVLASPLADLAGLDATYTHRVQDIGVGTEGGSELIAHPLAPLVGRE